MNGLSPSLTEQLQRARVVAAAQRWRGTPYHHAAQIHGVGIDCATLLLAAFSEAGVLNGVILPAYSPMWHLHKEEEKYTDFIRQFCAEVTDRGPLPGDIVVWKMHRCFAHGAIVVDWPTVIHAFIGIGCIEDDAERNQLLATVSERVPTQGQKRPMKLFSFWG